MSDHAFGLSTTAVAFIKAIMDTTYGMPKGTTAHFSGAGMTEDDFRLAHIELREGADHLIVFSDIEARAMTVTKRLR